MIKSLINKIGKLLGGSSSPNPQLEAFILKNATLVDVRTNAEFAGGSAEGAINIPLRQVKKRIGEFRNTNGIIVFCRSGGRSSQAIKILLANDISNVVNGGTWKAVRKIQGDTKNQRS